jgi:hypothetical protein
MGASFVELIKEEWTGHCARFMNALAHHRTLSGRKLQHLLV